MSDASAFALLGVLYAERGDADRARRSHAKAFELDGTQIDSARFLSDVLLAEDSLSTAARLHAAVLRSSPMCTWAAQRLGSYLLRQGRGEEALGAFQSMIRAAPQDPVGWEGLGDAYQTQGKYMAALQVCVGLVVVLFVTYCRLTIERWRLMLGVSLPAIDRARCCALPDRRRPLSSSFAMLIAFDPIA